jgi:hypothetical protein
VQLMTIVLLAVAALAGPGVAGIAVVALAPLLTEPEDGCRYPWDLVPHGGYGIDQAHRAMQRHRDCSPDRCPFRAEALQVLREAGRIQLDQRASERGHGEGGEF